MTFSAAAELAIRGRRAAFNRAIAEGDAGAIGPLLARDCVMVTGSDSAVISGRMGQVKVWRREFSASPRTVYVRVPEAVIVSDSEPLAMETGHWQGHSLRAEALRAEALRAEDAPLASGTYAAKWREVGGDWVIEAEVFVTLA